MPVITSPGLTVVLDQPFASIRLMAGPPTSHFSIVPSAALTSRVIMGCGFSHSNMVTVPFTVTSLDMSTGQEWWADTGTAPETNARMTIVGTNNLFATAFLLAGILEQNRS